MPRKKILWLCSWYPNKTDQYNGDFIQRHARAASLYNDIHVIHVTGDEKGFAGKTSEEFYVSGGLSEHIIYFRKSPSFWGKISGSYRLLELYRRAIKKYITENGNPALVHVQVPMKAGIAALWIKRKYRIPFIVTEHWGIYNNIVEDNYRKRSWFFKNYARRIIRNSSGLISVSKFLAEEINNRVIKKEYRVVPNVADTELFFYKEKEASKFRFIHVSNVVPLKNAEGILRSFRLFLEKNNNAELLMVGEKTSSVRDYAASLGLLNQSVFFYGEIPYAGVATKMQSSHCLVLFSNIENSPCVIGEALCCGLPVIATAVGGIPELVNNTNALLVDAGNEKELVVAMQQIADHYSQYDSKKIAGEARNRFSYAIVGNELDEIYNLVLQKRSTNNG